MNYRRIGPVFDSKHPTNDVRVCVAYVQMLIINLAYESRIERKSDQACVIIFTLVWVLFSATNGNFKNARTNLNLFCFVSSFPAETAFLRRKICPLFIFNDSLAHDSPHHSVVKMLSEEQLVAAWIIDENKGANMAFVFQKLNEQHRYLLLRHTIQ